MSTSETSDKRESIQWRKDLLRRRAIVRIPDVAILNAVNRRLPSSVMQQSRLHIVGLPEGCDVIGCWYSHTTREFEFVVLHESFQIVQDGMEPPKLHNICFSELLTPEPAEEVQALRAERDRLRAVLGKLCQADTPDEARQMLEVMMLMPPSEDRDTGIAALKELAGGAK